MWRKRYFTLWVMIYFKWMQFHKLWYQYPYPPQLRRPSIPYSKLLQLVQIEPFAACKDKLTGSVTACSVWSRDCGTAWLVTRQFSRLSAVLGARSYVTRYRLHKRTTGIMQGSSGLKSDLLLPCRRILVMIVFWNPCFKWFLPFFDTLFNVLT
jgi:hypothetical protein